MIVVKPNRAAAQAVVRRVDGLVSGIVSPQPALKAIGAALVARVQLTFRDGKTPWGEAWSPLSRVTLERRAARRSGGTIYKKAGGVKKGAQRIIDSAKPLLDTGALRNSVTYSVDADSVTVGTNKIQAGVLQYGAQKRQFKGVAPWGNVPARAFLPSRERGQLDLPPDWGEEILGIAAAHILGRTGASRAGL